MPIHEKPDACSSIRSYSNISDNNNTRNCHTNNHIKYNLYVYILFAVFLLPFPIFNFIEKEWLLLFNTTSYFFLLIFIIVFIIRMGEIPRKAILICGATGGIAVYLASYRLQIYGLLWTYPYIIYCYYFVGIRPAHINCAILVPAILVSAYQWSEHSEFIRIAGTLIIVWLFAGFSAKIIEDQHRKLINLARHDPLTGCKNRRELQTDLDQYHNQFNRNGSTCTLLILDLDHFKSVNDEYGHSAGDTALINLVKVIQSTINTPDNLYRFGGEEFVLLLPGINNSSAAEVANQLRKKIEQTTIIGTRAITISCGIAKLQRNETIDQWIKRADSMLYQAKINGRNRVESDS